MVIGDISTSSGAYLCARLFLQGRTRVIYSYPVTIWIPLSTNELKRTPVGRPRN